MIFLTQLRLCYESANWPSRRLFHILQWQEGEGLATQGQALGGSPCHLGGHYFLRSSYHRRRDIRRRRNRCQQPCQLPLVRGWRRLGKWRRRRSRSSQGGLSCFNWHRNASLGPFPPRYCRRGKGLEGHINRYRSDSPNVPKTPFATVPPRPRVQIQRLERARKRWLTRGRKMERHQGRDASLPRGTRYFHQTEAMCFCPAATPV
jgi:hypothetical protein